MCLHQDFPHLQKSSPALLHPPNPPNSIPYQNLSSTKLISLVMLFPSQDLKLNFH